MCSKLLRVRIASILPKTYDAWVEDVIPEHKRRQWRLQCPTKVRESIRLQMELLKKKWEGLAASWLSVEPTFSWCDQLIRCIGKHGVKGENKRHQIDGPRESVLTSGEWRCGAALCYVWMKIPNWAKDSMSSEAHYNSDTRIAWMPFDEEQELGRSDLRKGVNREFKRWWVDVMKEEGVDGVSQAPLTAPECIVKFLTRDVRNRIAQNICSWR